MLYCVAGLHLSGRRPLGLALAVVLVAGGCSGDMAPPGDLLGMEQAPPIIRSEPVAPMMSAAPVASSMFSGPDMAQDTALIPTGPDAPMQNVLAYPVSAGVDMNQMTSALPEGRVDQPVVMGIGTDTPRLAATPDDNAQVSQAPVSKSPVRLAGLMPRISNPLSTPQWAGGMPAAEKACRSRLKRLGVSYRDLPAINSGKGCHIPYPIEVTQLSGGIKILPAAKLNCQITDAFAQWVKNELAPAARLRYLSGVSSIRQLSSYSCRTMNSKRGAPMSEHASGNAIDVGKITLNSGQSISVRKPGFFSFREKSLLKTVRSDSCKYFTTVLGPGSDVHHKDHFHFDLRTRKRGYRHCD
ncbi:extensin family protein [Hoeflea sp. YIM 152468]|uniref:extensin-like domain-containing protein n=1 Tax=Hoeflea sp. YIM 152468 TaxID=3031759 RepID=UPI0023D9BCB9|nr:extensin family protein [Hoeflea sp. YIM 152468]MDF1609505.1 extensin family protein [Hoeflea sp. YIM 152468]